jgi:hypothetical protein
LQERSPENIVKGAMDYEVRAGDSLWRIAAIHFGDPAKWRELANDNHLHHHVRLLVGQHLHLRDSLVTRPRNAAPPVEAPSPTAATDSFEHSTPLVPARGFFFVLADEVNPLRQKVVRKVMVSPSLSQKLSERLTRPIPFLANPERFGLHPTGPSSPVSIGRHAMGMKPSPFSSASSSMLGPSRISGDRFWIDVEKAQHAGATFHDADEILADLDRIARKTAKAADLARVERIKALVRADAEVLIRGSVPAAAIKGAPAMTLTRGLQGVQIVGFAMTAIDVTYATQRSIREGSVKPLAAETVRQVGGWAAAWAGVKLGAAGGALLGVETGPGAILTGAAGGLIGGVAGYYGFDWIADHISAN